MVSKPTLIYWNVIGRGTGIRLLLKHAGVDFNEKLVTDFAKWSVLKRKHPERGGLPWYIDVTGKAHPQSCAIIRALAAQHGYICNDPWKQYTADYVFEFLHDIRESKYLDFVSPQWHAVFAR